MRKNKLTRAEKLSEIEAALQVRNRKIERGADVLIASFAFARTCEDLLGLTWKVEKREQALTKC